MLSETFIGRVPSHFNLNKLVEAFIVSETFFWAAWNFITPIFAIFVLNNIKGGNIKIAAFAFSIYLITRVIVEVIAGKYSTGKSDLRKLWLTIIGILLLSIAYVGFAFSSSISHLFLFYIITGIAIGIATPAKNSLFSAHLDKDREPTEWGIYDAVTLSGIALATVLGGFIASAYGFKPLFLLAALINILGTVPYIICARKQVL
jgi:MFS family permease